MISRLVTNRTGSLRDVRDGCGASYPASARGWQAPAHTKGMRMRSLARRFLGGTTLALVTGPERRSGADDLPERQGDRPPAGAVLLLRQRGLRGDHGPAEQLLHPPRPHRGPGQHLRERGGLHPAVVRGRPEPVGRGHHLHLDGRPGRRRHADDHLPHHRPERAPAAGRLDRRALHQGRQSRARSISAAGRRSGPTAATS